MSSDNPILRDASGNPRTLGVCWLVYGIIRLVMALCLFIYGSTATLMFGALLNRVPNPFVLMTGFHLLYIGLIILSVACGILGIVAGLSMLSRSSSARVPALVASFLSLSDIPLGLTLGVYTLVILLP